MPAFRTRQVLADLERVIDTGEDTDPWPVVLAPGSLPQDLTTAIATILHERIEARTADPRLDLLCMRHLTTIRAAPAPVRAALMHGFDHLGRHGLAPEDCQPTPGDLATTALETLEPHLIACARRMTVSELDHTARADYGCDVAMHRAALVTLLSDPMVAYPHGEVWFPAEVVDLVSNLPGAPGHVPCLAIVLLHALRDGDQRSNASFRLEGQFAQIAALPEAALFFAAFRHLYETDPDWNPDVPDHVTLRWS